MPVWRSKLRDRAPFLLVVALITWFWFPALLLRKVLIHGDSAIVGLPLMRLLARGLHEHESLLWFARLLGGHPLFAEGQGGFASPLHILIADLFDPVQAIGVIHWASVVIGAGGVYCLARQLGLSRWAGTFAALAAAFSSYWIVMQHNLPISTTLAWAPWLLVGLEYWLLQPTAARAALLAIPIACMVLAGYPQVAHGALLYAVLSLVSYAAKDGRRFVAQHARALVWSGALALALGVGLAAIQLVPLLELVQLSQRSHGTSLSFDGFMPPDWIKRGLLFLHVQGEPQAANLPSIGNISVVMLASLALVLRVRARLFGHAVAALVMFNLGIARASGLFSALYDHHLVPGLHSFRLMHPYLGVAVIGFAVVAAGALDQLAAEHPALWRVFQKRAPVVALCVGLLACGLAALCWQAYVPAVGWSAFIAPIIIAVGCIALLTTERARWLPLLAASVLAGDALALRMEPFPFFDRDVLEPPQLVQDVLKDPDLPLFRAMSLTGADAMTFKSPDDPDLRGSYARVLESVGYLPGLEWRVPTMDGVLALPLARYRQIRDQLQAEAVGNTDKPRGMRLIDILGIRYLSMQGESSARGLEHFAQDGQLHWYKNGLARARLSVYGTARRVDDAEAAQAGLNAAQRPTLLLEPSYAGEQPQIAPDVACPDRLLARAPLQIEEAGDTRYRLNVDVPCDCWLFLADANYPGWQARLNGARVPVYTAQVLGKAIQLPAGRHRVTFDYVPRSFYLGAAISGVALVVLLAIAWLASVRREMPARASLVPAPAVPDGRHWQIDALRGLCMIAVCMIHAEVLQGNLLHEIVVDRAVPILLVLFGASSELWWQRTPHTSATAATRAFWKTRLLRLAPPLWIATALWWCNAYAHGTAPSWRWAIPHALGYLPQVGTGWFPTLLVQLVVLFPLLHVAYVKCGRVACLFVAFLLTGGSQLYALQVIGLMRTLLLDSAPVSGFFSFYYLWIFAPVGFWLVYGGMTLARTNLSVRHAWLAACVAILVIGNFVRLVVLDVPVYRSAMTAVLDLPLAIVLLEAVRIGCPAAWKRALCWLGRGSWGVYLGQLVAHNALRDLGDGMFVDRAAGRWLYCGVLLLSGCLWIVIQSALQRLVRRRTTKTVVRPATAADARGPEAYSSVDAS